MTAALTILGLVVLAAILWLTIVATIRLDDVSNEVGLHRDRLDDLDRRFPR